jgi:hypothetical protein
MSAVPSLGALRADPVVVHALRVALAALLAAAAAHKLRDPAGFRATLRDYRLLPDAAVAATAAGLTVVEAGLALALLAPVSAPAAAWACVALLALYGGAIGANLARGRRHVACGCLGPSADEPLHGGMLVRNAILVLAALGAAAPAGARALGALDAFTVAAAAATLVLLYLAADGLMAGAHRAARSSRAS